MEAIIFISMTWRAKSSLRTLRDAVVPNGTTQLSMSHSLQITASWPIDGKKELELWTYPLKKW